MKDIGFAEETRFAAGIDYHQKHALMKCAITNYKNVLFVMHPAPVNRSQIRSDLVEASNQEFLSKWKMAFS